ncbi:MAG: zinc-binding alcohol dehydrogenase family protein, partial [Actinomycetota bacterium]
HIVEGDLPLAAPGVVPGHEVVGIVDALGPETYRFALGDRIGIAWLGSTCRTCRFCVAGKENLCLAPVFTGYHRDGGYADYAVADEDYAYRIPGSFDDEHAAPLLCAGIIGYRAYRKTGLPVGGRLGIYGFGGSAHIATQVAQFEGTRVFVMTRSTKARELAVRLGADYTGGYDRPPPEPLDAAILFAPDGALVPVALRALDRGGTLAVAGIHLSAILSLDYQEDLFFERRLVSVTANTRTDGEELMDLAARIPIEVETTPFPLDEADRALAAMAQGRLSGAAVLIA